MTDPSLNNLLKWGINHSSGSGGDTGRGSGTDSTRGIDRAALAHLLGGPSDADRMREAMAAIQSSDVDLENKRIAFDNLEQLIENIDNTNNMESLGLWTPLVEQLANPEPDMRLGAAWCIATAVQNNSRAQERCLAVGAIPVLSKIAQNDNDPAVRRKAIFALSSEVRNYQPGLNELLRQLPGAQMRYESIDAADMEAVDTLMQELRDRIE